MARLFIVFIISLFVFQETAFSIDLTKSEEKVVKKKEKAHLFPLGGLIILDNSVGWGTFIDHPYERQPSYGMSATFYPRYRWTKSIYTGILFSLSKEIVTNASFSYKENHETIISDITLRTGDTKIVTIPGGFILGAYADLIFPTSKASRFYSRYLLARAALQLSKQLGPVSLKYTFRFSKSFNKYNTSIVDSDNGAIIGRPLGNEIVTGSLVSTGKYNVNFDIVNQFTVEWSIFNTNLSLLVDFFMRNSWAYSSPNDEFTADNAIAGAGRRDDTIGTVELDYMVMKNLVLALGVYTWQAPKSYDNKSFRIPFFNWKNLADNSTAVYFDIIGIF